VGGPVVGGQEAPVLGGQEGLKAGLAIKIPPEKHTQKNPKNAYKNQPQKMDFLGFLNFFIFYENNTNFSL
jgi:hypothetical protein